MKKMRELYKKVAADSALQTKFKEILGTAEKDGKESTEAKLLTFAHEAGFEVTMEEANAFLKTLSEDQKGELSQEELDMVAGGKGGVLLSIGTLGLMCAAGSAVSEIDGGSCKDFIQEYL